MSTSQANARWLLMWAVVCKESTSSTSSLSRRRKLCLCFTRAYCQEFLASLANDNTLAQRGWTALNGRRLAEVGCDKQVLGFAAQYESTFGKPATVKDYTELVHNHKPLPGSAHPPFSNTSKKDGQADSKKSWTSDPRRTRKSEPERKYMAEPERKYMSHWFCGQIVNGKACGQYNFYYAEATDTVVTDAYCYCPQPKKEQPKKALHAGGEGRPSFASTLTLGSVAIEKMIEEKIAIGVQQALDTHTTSDGSALAGIMQSESGNAFSLGLRGIVDNSMDGDNTLFPVESEAVADKFGNNAEAYLVRN